MQSKKLEELREGQFSVEELMQENSMSDPNRLAIDDMLVIPVAKSLEPTARPMATESAMDTDIVLD